MATGRVPIVLGDAGTWEQLQPGDDLLATLHLEAGSPRPASFVFQSLSLDFAEIAAGQACAIHSNGNAIIRAIASNALAAAVGLAQYNITPGNPGYVQTAGLFELADWTAVIGSPALFPRGVYFLDPLNAGRLTRVVPTTVGQIAQQVGFAVNATTLSLSCGPTVLL